MKKITTTVVLFLILSVLLVSFPEIGIVKAVGTIYIRADGSVEGTDKIQRDGEVYTITANITNQSIVVERDNIVVDGAGYTLDGTGTYHGRGTNEAIGVNVTGQSGITIRNFKITSFFDGINLLFSSNNTIYGNNITNTDAGIIIDESSYNIVSNNGVQNCDEGIAVIWHSMYNELSENNVRATTSAGITLFWQSPNNTLIGNTITGADFGVWIGTDSNTLIDNIIMDSYLGVRVSGRYNTLVRNTIANCGPPYNVTTAHGGIWIADKGNIIYHNKFIDNNPQVFDAIDVFLNKMDDGYPSGGNYWSDYTDTDQYSGPYQNEAGSDGIWDHSYKIDFLNVDNYPVIPEFPSWIILPLLMIAPLFVIIFKKKVFRLIHD